MIVHKLKHHLPRFLDVSTYIGGTFGIMVCLKKKNHYSVLDKKVSNIQQRSVQMKSYVTDVVMKVMKVCMMNVPNSTRI